MVNKMCKAFGLILIVALVCVEFAYGTWEPAHATFYGNMDGDETYYGACGYDVFHQGYGFKTTALSTALFQNGAACGACFEIVCYNAPGNCIKNAGPIIVTATNFCPPNYAKTKDLWCNPPLKHFDLSQPMFRKIAVYEAGIVPVLFRRVKCGRKGGMRFQIKGNPYWMLVLVYNVGGVGDVANVKIKGSHTGWIQTKRNWGQNWQTSERLYGQSLSFEVITSDGRIVWSNNVAPANWQFDQSYEGKNF